MATELVGKNKKSISMYCAVLRISGWLIVSSSGLLPILQFIEYRTNSQRLLYVVLPHFVISYLFIGVFALGLAQLISYIFDNKYRAGWLLRRADKIIYIYAATLLISKIMFAVNFLLTVHVTHTDWYWIVLLVVLLLLKLLILIGAGGILRRVMPIIEESKTLV